LADLLEHRGYLQDQHRFDAYDEALRSLAPQRVVLDLGAGTGLLGLTALRRGAAQVYAVEATGLADWTSAIATSNRAEDRYVVIPGSSRELVLPKRVDLVVCDQLGGFICEGMPLPALADAASRHLKPGGRLMPSKVEFAVRPLRSPSVADHLDFWEAPHFDLNVLPLRSAAVGTPLYEHSPASTFAGLPSSLGVLDTSDHFESVELRTTIHVAGNGPVNALAGFFTAELAPGITITNAPDDPLRIDRQHIVLPLDPPFETRHADTLEVRIRALLHSGVLSWTVSDAGGSRRRHSTWQGYSGQPIPRG
jgi:hypothetical protein